MEILTKNEELVSHYDKQLCEWMKYVRNFHSDNSFWIDQTDFNLPILALASLEIPDGDIFFTMRDSIYWKPLFEKITKRFSKAFISSRQALYGKSDRFKQYINDLQLNENSIIIDLYGSGLSLSSYFDDKLPNVIFLSCSEIHDVSSKIKFFDYSIIGNNILERLNTCTIGSVDSNYNEMPCEYDLKIANIQSEAMNIAIESISSFKIKQNKDLMSQLIERLPGCHTDKIVPKYKHNKK